MENLVDIGDSVQMAKSNFIFRLGQILFPLMPWDETVRNSSGMTIQ